jgi:drug/metabolite transporter (DMT)-like permease
MKGGALYMLIVGLTLSAMGAIGKWVRIEATASQIVLFQYLVGLCWLFPLALIKRGVKAFASSRWGLHLVRDVAGSISYYCLFLALPYIDLADAVSLNNTGPLFVPLFDKFWLGQRVPRSLWWGPLLGFGGVLCILQPGANFHPAMLLGLASGITMAVTFICIRLLNQTEAPYITLLYYFFIATLIALPVAIARWQPLSGGGWLGLIGIGLLMSIMQACLIYAFQRGKASILGPLIYTSLIWSGVIDWAIWGEVPNGLSFVGFLLVIVGGGISIFAGHLLTRSPSTPVDSD